MIGVAAMLMSMLRRVRVDRHAADGIDDAVRRWAVVFVMVCGVGHISSC